MDAIKLVEVASGWGSLEPKPRYDVVFNGNKIGQLHYNEKGYTGCAFPRFDGTKLRLPEMSITLIRKEVKKINNKWARGKEWNRSQH